LSLQAGGVERLEAFEARFAVALLRAGLVPVIVLGEAVAGQDDRMPSFAPLLAVAAVWALLALVAAVLGWRPPWLRVLEPVLDVALLCGLAYGSGGGASELRKAFFLLPLGAAFIAPPRIVVVWAAIAVVGFLGLSVLHPASDLVLEAAAAHALYLSWAGAGAVALAAMLTRRAGRVAELAAVRGRLVGATLDAETRERRRLAEALHDEPLQNVLAARQELTEARLGDPAALEFADAALARTVQQLREEVFNLHPQVLESAGLEAAIRAVAAQQARLGGFAVDVRVCPELRESRDPQLLGLARELLVNAARHARARDVRVSVLGEDGSTVLEVVDDGRGMPLDRPHEAQREGHIGLAAAAERATARGGRLRIRSAPGEGTRVRIAVPRLEPLRSEETQIPLANRPAGGYRDLGAPGMLPPG
jgi:two-component system, NarL family, sensor kinase